MRGSVVSGSGARGRAWRGLEKEMPDISEACHLGYTETRLT